VTQDQMHDGWIVRHAGPSDADRAVLFLPGALASAPFYDDVLAEPSLTRASVRFVTTTLPGYAGTPSLADPSMESLAASASKLAVDFGCDVIVGHSLGANVALEMAGSQAFSGPLVLLSPSFSRKDESRFPRTLDRLSRVLGTLPYALMLKIIGPAMKSSLPPARREALIAELKKNDPRDVRRGTRLYLEYLDRHGSLVARLCDSGVQSWIVFGERDDIGLRDDERRSLEACGDVTLVTIADTGHFALNDKPARVAEIVLEAVSSVTSS
jgi:pimeloyl-ACP methyl ester carboxylesterase